VSGTKPYGLTRDWTGVIDEEAKVIREVATRVIDGESLNQIARDLTRRGVHAPAGAGVAWSGGAIAKIMRAARLNGDRSYEGAIVARDCFPAILDRETTGRVQSELAARRTVPRPRKPRSPLHGLARCTRCGSAMMAATVHEQGVLRCGGRAPSACNRNSMVRWAIEEVVKRAVLDRIDRRQRATTEHWHSRAVDTDAFAAALHDHGDKLRQLSLDYYTRGLVGRAEFTDCRDRLNHDLEMAKRSLVPSWREEVLDTGTTARELQSRWDEFPIERRRRIITTELEIVRIRPSDIPGRFDLGRIELVWWEPNPIGPARSRLRWPPMERPPRRVVAPEPRSDASATWLSVEQMTKRLGLAARSTVWGAIRLGLLPAVKHDRRWQVRESDFDAYVRTRRQQPPTRPESTAEPVSTGLVPMPAKRSRRAPRRVDPREELGQRVRARRTELGLSQDELGAASGLHRTYVGSVERGERNIALLNIVAIAQALGVDPGELVRGMRPVRPRARDR
jgi:ribosome-binding protein aMBF1 (putative translation factor)